MAPPPQLERGHAGLHIGLVRERSVVLRSWSTDPLRLLSPRVNGSGVWAYSSTLGGGMVAGDCTEIAVQVDAGARCFLGTQSSTKVYRSSGGLGCSHRLTATLAEESLLIVAPDPVQPFADSVFDQQQTFSLTSSSNLIVIDSVSGAPRLGGHRWCFGLFSSRLDVVREGRLLLTDRLRLMPGEADPFAVGRFNCLATVLVMGPALAEHAAAIAAAIALEPLDRTAANRPLAIGASRVHDGLLLRVAGETVETVQPFIQRHLGFVRDLLRDNPWQRKW